jgi:hypothetical protein
MQAESQKSLPYKPDNGLKLNGILNLKPTLKVRQLAIF